ncbi:unnamed protein product [Brassica oleracea]
MAAFNSVAELKPFKFMWKIQVKIIRLWKQYSAGGGLTFEMVLVDMSVSFSIHATVKQELTSGFNYVTNLEGGSQILFDHDMAEIQNFKSK